VLTRLHDDRWRLRLATDEVRHVMHGEHGRWGGRLTKRPLPDRDAELDALCDADRAELGAIWLSRAASERRVGDAFAVIAGDLVELDAPVELVALARRSVDDELRHAELARFVASRCAGRELDAPAPLTLVVPGHPGAPARVVAALHVVGHCVFNETFASAYLETSLELARAPLSRAALRALLSDEIDHARIGWALLAALRSEERRALAPWLPSLLFSNLAEWRAAERPGSARPVLDQHGIPSRSAVEQALLGAARELILPGLERLGFETRALAAWIERNGVRAPSSAHCWNSAVLELDGPGAATTRAETPRICRA
jgi:hypothetical protein